MAKPPKFDLEHYERGTMAQDKYVMGNAFTVIEVEPIWEASLPDDVRVVGVFYDLGDAKAHMEGYDTWEYDTENMRWIGRGAMGNYCLIVPVYIKADNLKDIIHGAD